MSAAEPAVSVVGARGLPAATDQVRRANTALVLRALRDVGPQSRTGLARSTGLTKSTVSAIVTRLQSLGAVEEGASTTPARGRPSTPMRLSGEHLVSLGAEVNVDYLAAVCVDLAGRTVLAEEQAVRSPPDLDQVRDFVGRCHDALTTEGRRVLGVSVAVPGLVDRDRGRVASAPNLGWRDVPVAAVLHDVVAPDCEVRLDNDANCAALAESLRGAAKGLRSVLYVTGTVGVGGGIISDGRMVRGGLGYAGEIGHMRVGASQARCACGRRGCWEALVGLRAMLAAVGLVEPPDTDPVRIARLVAARAVDDASVRAGLAQVGEDLAAGCAVLANALDPAAIVLGGYFEPLGPWLLPRVQRALDEDVFGRRGCRAVLSTLGLHAAATGAALEILDDVFDARLRL